MIPICVCGANCDVGGHTMSCTLVTRWRTCPSQHQHQPMAHRVVRAGSEPSRRLRFYIYPSRGLLRDCETSNFAKVRFQLSSKSMNMYWAHLRLFRVWTDLEIQNENSFPRYSTFPFISDKISNNRGSSHIIRRPSLLLKNTLIDLWIYENEWNGRFSHGISTSHIQDLRSKWWDTSKGI